MKSVSIYLTSLAVFLLPLNVAALEVVEGKIAQGVSAREPVAAGESFQDSVGELYCFTRVVGAEGETVITHVWRHAGKEMGRVDLPVRSPDWRTWSSKRILPAWTGPWRVDVLDSGGSLLKQLSFSVGDE